MTSIRTSVAESRYTAAAGEFDCIAGTVRSWAGYLKKGIIYCHGASSTAPEQYFDVDRRPMFEGLVPYGTVHIGDLGDDAWANDTCLGLVEDAVDYMRANWFVEGQFAFIGNSMGAATALAYANQHPEDVLCIAAIQPALDFSDLMTRGAAASINAAYGGSYDDETDGPDHSPDWFVEDLNPSIPIHLFTSSTDAFAVPATADAFVTARPQTERTNVGNVVHGDAMVVAATAGVIEFVAEHLG